MERHPEPDAGRSAGDLPPRIETRRMRLAGLAHGDLFELVRLGREERVNAALVDGRVDSLPLAAALVDHAQRVAAARPGLGFWRADDARGFIGFFSLTAELDPSQVTIGVRLLTRAWGRAYALEGGEALCRHAFDGMGVDALHGDCAPENRAVPPLLARLGFEPAGEREQFGNRALRFTLRREDWRGIRPRARG